VGVGDSGWSSSYESESGIAMAKMAREVENGGKLTPLFHVEDTSIIASMPSPARHRHSSLTLLRQQAMI